MSATTAIIRPKAGRNGGLDLLRLVAMALVVLQHGFTVVDHYDWTTVVLPGITLGQFGVSIFCAISGWYALAGDQPPLAWLIARLTKLYPAFWIATLFAFGLAMAMGRPITAGLFLSQMAGTGFFTHGWDLINVVSWFISLILLCYGLSTLARWTGRPVFVMGLIFAGVVALVALQIEIALSRHVLAFAAAAILGRTQRAVLLPIVALGLLPFMFFQPSFIYAIAALPALWIARNGIRLEARIVSLAAASTYEFFLLHGVFLAGAAKLTSSPILVIAIGVACSIPGALLLNRAAAILCAAAKLIRPLRWRAAA